MNKRQDDLVRVDSTGTAHPVGRVASRRLRQRQGSFVMVDAPDDVILLRAEDGGVETAGLWMAGELRRPGALWDVFGLIGQGKWTGELVVVDEEARRSILVHSGTVVGTRSSSERERIGGVLYSYGQLNRAQLDAVARRQDPGMRFGEAAVALGYITTDQLREMLNKQGEDIVHAALEIDHGAFHFVERLDEASIHHRLKLPVHAMVMESARRMDETGFFRTRIPSAHHVPARQLGRLLTAEHEHHVVFLLVDGDRTVEQIARIVGQGLFDTTRALFDLVQQGVVTVHPPRPTGGAGAVELFNQAIALILSEIDPTGRGRDVREQLASFATASGVYDALFRDAGPAEDGTLDAAKVASTMELLAGPSEPHLMLAQWLYEYAAFALFVAEPVMRARPGCDAAEVSARVTELLAPLAPES